jgi:hypothetical protein
MAKWEQTTGEIVESRVGVYYSSEGDEMGRPFIRWTYIVNGRRYYGELPDMGYYRAKALVSKYPKGRRVEVHYNPTKPEESVVKGLEGFVNLGSRSSPFFLLISLLLMLLLLLPLILIFFVGSPAN